MPDVNFQSIGELFSVSLLDSRCHLVIAESQVVYLVREVKELACPVEVLNCGPESMRGYVEVTWDLVDNQRPEELTALLLAQSLRHFIYELLRVVIFPFYFIKVDTCFFELVALCIESDLVKLPLDVDLVDPCHVLHVNTDNVTRYLWNDDV